MLHIEREIAEQPAIVGNLIDRESETAAQIAKAIRDFDPVFIHIAARGTSDNAARYAQYAFGIHAHLPVALDHIRGLPRADQANCYPNDICSRGARRAGAMPATRQQPGLAQPVVPDLHVRQRMMLEVAKKSFAEGDAEFRGHGRTLSHLNRHCLC